LFFVLFCVCNTMVFFMVIMGVRVFFIETLRPKERQEGVGPEVKRE